MCIRDRDNQVLRPSIIWCDSRAVPYGAKAFEELGEKWCLSHLLNSPGNFTAAKLAWVKDQEPALYERVHKLMLPGDYIALAVTDTGVGMAPDVRERALEPFFTTKDVGKGSGLGLSMIYGFARQSKGHVKIYSEVGHGTTVRLYLPRDTSSTEELSIAEAGASDAGTESILVVEDDQFIRELYIDILQDEGYDVDHAVDGEEGYAKLHMGGFDLVLLDIMLPKIDGIKILEKLKNETQPVSPNKARRMASRALWSRWSFRSRTAANWTSRSRSSAGAGKVGFKSTSTSKSSPPGKSLLRTSALPPKSHASTRGRSWGHPPTVRRN